MITRDEAKSMLTRIVWEEGKIVHLEEGPYRHTIMLLCSKHGRQKAIFFDGQEHNYFCYLKMGNGANIVPVLPDGRLVLITEQRPALGLIIEEARHISRADGSTIDLLKYGPYTALEFPSGAVNPGEDVRVGAIREMCEEMGAVKQKALMYRTAIQHAQMSSDVTTMNTLAVIYLTSGQYADRVESDGGLNVFALTPDEVELNLERGVIRSGLCGLHMWMIYKEINAAYLGQKKLSRLFTCEEVDVDLSVK